jgi:hypothetical protein
MWVVAIIVHCHWFLGRCCMDLAVLLQQLMTLEGAAVAAVA